MARFRKRPVEIDAFRLPLEGDMPDWLSDAVASGKIRPYRGGARIDTLEGLLTATPGDWIIRGVKGELYSCKPDVFALTYEAVEDDRSAPARLVGGMGR
ncbi:hypothetical protein [uncultured Phenylobacterium sp.]|uniref:hypothetical protein n=1 Tax=uncultured Phenylobacterium sp. TaxID=349273 RepID=UPI0025EF6160|nr:hypothetical protein [uncultured Phenylobacterium sp.]